MSQLTANLALLLAALLWGAGNVAQKTVLDDLGPITTVTLRFAIAALVMAPFVVLRKRQPQLPGFASSALSLSVLLALALAVQQCSYSATSVTHASFLVNVGTIITPFLAWRWIGEKPGWSLAIAVPLGFTGAMLMSGAAIGRLSAGDAACLVSAALYAVWTVKLGQHAQAFGSPGATAFVQFIVGALVCLPVGLLIESTPLASIRGAMPELIVLGVFSTAAAFALQTTAQRHTPAAHAALIVSSESVFGAAGAYFFLSEQTGSMGITGAILILAGIVLISAWPALPAGASGRLKSRPS